MNPVTENNWGIPQRQAKAGLVIIIAKATVTILKTLGPLLLVLLVKNKKGIDMLEVTLMALPVIILVRSLIGYFYFRFFIANDELIIRKGLISKNHYHPLQKYRQFILNKTYYTR
ncbi:hypothetical protein [Paraflavitalea speifideaquila]|uniref:hypothetical protein n=1 Tax=Paraflavitalea speifideaquila TaxID=3076558 RepID=UPI0028E5761B|nr:hypothetical protein [Paraflavitalea speifideiaquila]